MHASHVNSKQRENAQMLFQQRITMYLQSREETQQQHNGMIASRLRLVEGYLLTLGGQIAAFNTQLSTQTHKTEQQLAARLAAIDAELKKQAAVNETLENRFRRQEESIAPLKTGFEDLSKKLTALTDSADKTKQARKLAYNQRRAQRKEARKANRAHLSSVPSTPTESGIRSTPPQPAAYAPQLPAPAPAPTATRAPQSFTMAAPNLYPQPHVIMHPQPMYHHPHMPMPMPTYHFPQLQPHAPAAAPRQMAALIPSQPAATAHTTAPSGH